MTSACHPTPVEGPRADMFHSAVPSRQHLTLLACVGQPELIFRPVSYLTRRFVIGCDRRLFCSGVSSFCCTLANPCQPLARTLFLQILHYLHRLSSTLPARASSGHQRPMGSHSRCISSWPHASDSSDSQVIGKELQPRMGRSTNSRGPARSATEPVRQRWYGYPAWPPARYQRYPTCPGPSCR